MENGNLPNGFRYAGVISGLRNEPNRRDVAVIISETSAAAAGVFTQNRVCAAPVHVSRAKLPRPDARAIVICSGNANACTGESGMSDARRMCELVAKALGCSPEQVLVASTGVIGRALPMPILEAAIPKAVAGAMPGMNAFQDAAHAILTTDTKIKVSSRNSTRYTITGFAKGAAMIGPNMATMLGFVMTDAAVAPQDIQTLLKEAVEPSFNCISVEGHMSTNDTVFLLANGQGPPLKGAALQEFATSTRQVCADLAKQIASDAEGANHLITIHVTGTQTDADARTIAKTIAESALVKTAVFGADPNWGRIVSAAGYSGVMFEERDLSLKVGPHLLYEKGRPLPFDAATVSGYLKNNRDVTFDLTFTLGKGRCTFYTCDLTNEYVTLNADYTT
jgi:glutamate N-acetyltransferase / amino-acid N-acetyltransferase